MSLPFDMVANTEYHSKYSRTKFGEILVPNALLSNDDTDMTIRINSDRLYYFRVNII